MDSEEQNKLATAVATKMANVYLEEMKDRRKEMNPMTEACVVINIMIKLSCGVLAAMAARHGITLKAVASTYVSALGSAVADTESMTEALYEKEDNQKLN